MDTTKRKEIRQEWKNRHPEMGIISFRSVPTGEAFLALSKDMPAEINSKRFQLRMGMHPNKRLSALWGQYGEEQFDLVELAKLDYDNPDDDHTSELEDLLAICLAENEQAEMM